eukprot:UN03751
MGDDATAADEETRLQIYHVPEEDVPLTIEEKTQRRITEQTLNALRFKLLSLDYQTTLMRARYEVAAQQHGGRMLATIGIPNVDGVKFVDFPFAFPQSAIDYLKKNPDDDDFAITTLKLLSPNSFFKSVNDEYRFIFNEMMFYYNYKTQPLNLGYQAETYLTPEHYHAVVKNTTHKANKYKTAINLFDHNSDGESSDEEGSGGAASRKSRKSKQPQVPQHEPVIVYTPALGSLKTYLNNVLGVPLWYAVVLANFIFKLQAFITDERNTQPPLLVIQQMHQYQRNILCYVIDLFFKQHRTSLSQNLANPKDRYFNQFFGGGRAAENKPKKVL